MQTFFRPFSIDKIFFSIVVFIIFFIPPFKHRCKARVRTKGKGKHLEIVDRTHNHIMLTERRKKGTLKAMYAEKKLKKMPLLEIASDLSPAQLE